MCLFVRIHLYLRKVIQPIWILCCSSTRPRRFKCPEMVRPRYLCFSSPHNTANKSPQPSMYNGCCKYEVVNNLVFEVFSCKPTRLSSTTSNSNISTSSFHDFANNKRSSAYRIFVSLSTAPTCRPCDFKDCFQFRMACSSPELNNIGLKTSPCFTPRVMSKTQLLPRTIPDCPVYSRRNTWRYVSGTPCACNAWNKESCSMRSKAFCRSRLANQMSDSQAKHLPQTFSKTTIASSIPRPRRKPSWSAGCSCSKKGAKRFNNNIAKIL